MPANIDLTMIGLLLIVIVIIIVIFNQLTGWSLPFFFNQPILPPGSSRVRKEIKSMWCPLLLEIMAIFKDDLVSSKA